MSFRTKLDAFEIINFAVTSPRKRSKQTRNKRTIAYIIIHGSHGRVFSHRFRNRIFVSPMLSKMGWLDRTQRPRDQCQCSVSKRVHYPREKARSIIVLVRLDQTEKQRAPRVTACNNWTGGAFSSWPSPVVFR